ncbi:ABC transporter substrate-binding protein [Desulfovibrio sp.]|uniref:ABC transporter substrate-binding protein n=1 Tax=Desulfovibrio sp. TaxID=885 RepID=UPI003D137F1C
MAKALSLLLLALVLLTGAAPAGARPVTDAMGRLVEVPEPQNVRRVIALGSSMAFVTYLGAQDRIVGVEDIDKAVIAKPYVLCNRERFKDLPVVGKGGAVRVPNYERIVALNPDVVFIISTDPSEPDQIQRKLRVPVIVLSQGLPAFDSEIFFESILLAGNILGREERAQELVTGIGDLAKRLPVPAEQAMVQAYMGGLSYKGNQDIKSTAADFLPFTLSGVKNMVDGMGQSGHFFINREFLLAADPPLIFIDGNGLPLIRQALGSERRYYERLTALTSGNTWLLLPHTAYFNNPEVLYINAFFMAKAAYPQRYSSLDPEALADEIFILFNGCPLYEDMVRVTGRPGRLQLTAQGLDYAR